MKRNIIAAAAAAAAGIAFYYIRKRKTAKTNDYTPQESRPSHHKTDIFARAKEQAAK